MTVIALAVLALVTPGSGEPGCQTRSCERRVERKRRARVVAPYNSKLNRMAACESGGRWSINTGNGYYGGLQFNLQTWRGVGGWSYPHLNSPLNQKYRAVLLIKRRGYQPWPVCGRR